MNPSFDLTDAHKVTLGVVGEPGRRVFYLQAHDHERIVNLKMEKAQVAALSEYLDQLLADRDLTGSEPNLVFTPPEDHDWIVGNISLGIDDNDERVVLLVEELVLADPTEQGLGDDPEVGAAGGASASAEPTPTGALARLALTPRHAKSLAALGTELVNSGRPPCRWCGHPLDPSGHSCPRTNGHHRP